MKRLIAIATVVAMCMSLSVFGAEDAYTMYARMQEKMLDVTSMEVQADVTATIEVAGESVDMDMSMLIREIIHSETDVEMEMLMNASVLGETVSGAMYYKDGFMYQNINGEQTKTALSLDDAMKQSGAVDMDVDILEEMIKEGSAVSVEGGTQLSIIIDKQYMDDLVGDVLDSTLAGMGLGDMTMSFTDITYTATIGTDDMLKNYRMIFGMDMEISGVTASVQYDMDCTVISLNSISRIYYPLNMFGYKEV